MTGVPKTLYIITFAALLTIATGCKQQVSTPAAGQLVNLQSEYTAAEKLEPNQEVNTSMPLNENNQKTDEPDHAQSPKQPAAPASEPLSSPLVTALPLLLDLTEITTEAYIDNHSLKAKMSHPVTAAATRIAKATVNPAVFNQGAICGGGLITLRLFDDTECKIRITNYTAGSPVSFSGASENGSTAFIFASIDSNTLMVTLEKPGTNKIYLLKYSPKTNEYYLFQAPLQNLGVLEDAPPLIPPAAE